MMRKKYLVEIGVKTWYPKQVFGYEEVEAEDEYYARHRAIESFKKKVQYQPNLRKLLEQTVGGKDFCVSDCFEL